ncbi:MAG TPA: CBS domain-containing protein [Streptosporangiaceae bacterium]|nr:CBS domain-containing protein [Streptosporangiaceae bacterium]
MSRREEYLESMLRDLGSAYYQTLHGRGSASDVARAVESVRAHRAMSDQAVPGEAMPDEAVPDQASADRPARRRAGAGPGRPAGGRTASSEPSRPVRGRWRVTDVMSTDVLTVSKNMPYKQVAQLLAENDLTSVPVVSGGGRVLGMVSEADVLRREERTFSRLSAGLPRRSHHEREQAEALTAVELMSTPAITIHPDAPLGSAARLMNGHHIRRLPVVDSVGQLLGVVSRRDLLSVFLRPDAEIAAEVRAALTNILLTDAKCVAVKVSDGVVVLTGELPSVDLVSAAARLAAEVDGVVAVSSRLTTEPELERTS